MFPEFLSDDLDVIETYARESKPVGCDVALTIRFLPNGLCDVSLGSITGNGASVADALADLARLIQEPSR